MMKNHMRYLKQVTILTATLIGTSAFAGNAIEWGTPIFSGSGCLPNTYDFALSPENEALSILFDHYRAEAGNGTKTAIASCKISVPIRLPDGMSMSVIKADYRGFHALSAGATAQFSARYEFQGLPNNKSKNNKIFKGPMTAEFFESNQNHAYSACGGMTYLNIDTSLVLNSNSQQDSSFSSLDTVDTTSGQKNKSRQMKYIYKVKKCK